MSRRGAQVTEIIHINPLVKQVNWGTTTGHTSRDVTKDGKYSPAFSYAWRIQYIFGHLPPRHPVPALIIEYEFGYQLGVGPVWLCFTREAYNG